MLEAIGIIGVACILGSYFMLQRGSWSPHSAKYLLVNITGSAFVIVSLMDNWNLPSFIIQCAWIGISIYGFVKHKRKTS